MERNDVPVLEGKTYRIQTPCGAMYVTVNKYDSKIVEVFAKLGKAGGCPTCQIDVQARLISIALQNGVNIEKIIKQLLGNKCPETGLENENIGLSCPDAIGKVLRKEL